VGFLTLDRPKVVNVLTHAMIAAMWEVLQDWANDDDIQTVVLSGAGERGLCAGGDIVAVYHSAQADGALARQFWRDQYVLNDYIGSYPKPYVALMDGIVIGGGLGVSAHGSFRVVTDTSKISLPEVGLGFYPDVGVTHLLSRAPHQLGMHVGLTGARFSGADAIAMGIADHYVPHCDLPIFVQSIIDDGLEGALIRHAQHPPPSDLLTQRDWIDECYSANTVVDVIAALRSHDSDAANHAADLIATHSPLALSATFEAIRRSAKLGTLEDALQQDFRVSCALLHAHDLTEGVRAKFIDKGGAPCWKPSSLAEVSPEEVTRLFRPVDGPIAFSRG
jgi:enoyl-CoA hydratase